MVLPLGSGWKPLTASQEAGCDVEGVSVVGLTWVVVVTSGGMSEVDDDADEDETE